jgi:hypothetical protein
MNETRHDAELLQATAAAGILKLSTASVRLLALTGVLPCTYTSAGVRIYRRADVERLAAARARSGSPRVSRTPEPLRKGA